jgi:hypothetical protein
MAASYQILRDRRSAFAKPITAAIGKLAVLVRQEFEVRHDLLRCLRVVGMTADPFSRAVTVADVISRIRRVPASRQ